MTTTTESMVQATSHPLQQVGAYALLALAKVDSFEQLTPAAFERARARMAGDVAATAKVEDAKAAGGFWLGASYLLWPNSAMNTTNRKKLTPAQRRDRIEEWRRYPDDRLDAPCALCGRSACGFFGKVDVPLGASVAHRNTTVPGHEGLALCVGCLACLHALPYGCEIRGGRAATLHSWDERFLREVVRARVIRTQQQAIAGQPAATAGPYERELTALRRLKDYGEIVRAGVELYVFSNSNKEQVLDVQSLEQPLAEWLRVTMRNESLRRGFLYLVRAHWTEKVGGSRWLARDAFRNPDRIPRRAISYLAGLCEKHEQVPLETGPLVALTRSFAMEVLQVNEDHIRQIRELAVRIADRLAVTSDRGPLKKFQQHNRDPRQLQGWLKSEAVDWTLKRKADQLHQPFYTDDHWRLLFEADGQSRLNQDLLFAHVLESLAERGWVAKNADGSDDRADREDNDVYEEEQ